MSRRAQARPPEWEASCLYQCEQCGQQERIPADVLAYFDAVDPGGAGCARYLSVRPLPRHHVPGLVVSRGARRAVGAFSALSTSGLSGVKVSELFGVSTPSAGVSPVRSVPGPRG